MDRSSVQVENQRRIVWWKSERTGKDGADRGTTRPQYILMRMEFDCANRTYRRLQETGYSEKGDVLYFEGPRYLPLHVTPDTGGALVLRAACAQTTSSP